MNIVSSIFDTIGATIEAFFTVLSDSLTSVVDLFYTTTEGAGQFTFLGTMLMISLGVGLVWTLIKWISGLVRNVAR